MSLSLRILLSYCLLLLLSGYFVFDAVLSQVKPMVRQSAEETLIDTANLLAELLREDLVQGRVSNGALMQALAAYGQRRLQADIWGLPKQQTKYRVYVTDARGQVILDSTGQALGADYSRWNDVYRTLRGQYGARSTASNLKDPFSTVMYVAAPIRQGPQIIGVVSVGKANRNLQPLIDRTEHKLLSYGGVLLALSLLISLGFSGWLRLALKRLVEYADTVSQGQRASLDDYQAPAELARLAQALQRMRQKLDGRDYISRYVDALTHELKSPLASIKASNELLQDIDNDRDRRRFLANIDAETGRMQQLIEQLLLLARLEQQQQPAQHQPFNLHEQIRHWCESQQARLEQRQVQPELRISPDACWYGEAFWLQLALNNLLDNALAFATAGSPLQIRSEIQGSDCWLHIANQGPPIPDYAWPHLTERFYSQPRPDTGRKSSGLGLSLVQEIAELHQGRLQLRNTATGVEASLCLPLFFPH